jgi:hypothetical protein
MELATGEGTGNMLFKRINAWIDRVNTRLVNRLPSRRFSVDIALTDTGLHIKRWQDEDENIAWEDIAEIIATRSEQLVGNTLLLLVGLKDGRVLTVPEDAMIWQELTTLLPKRLAGAKPYEEWALQTAFSDATPREVIFRGRP